MTRRMKEPAYLAEQLQHRFDSHIKPINDYVDEISTPDLWVPYVAPIHGGIDARVLSVQVVLLQGGDARKSWRRVLRRSPNIANDLTVISTYHPGAQALWHKDLAERIRRVTHQADAYQQLAAALA